jgi:hypothetical protein
MGMLGFMGAVAMTVTVPINPEHCAMPVTALMLTPAGTGIEDIKGPIDHVTGVIAFIGAMLKFPIAVNWTIPFDEFLGSADIGVTVMLCNWRPCIDMEVPPQEIVSKKTADTNRKRITADSLRIDTSRFQTAEKGKGQRKGERIASKYATPPFQGKKQYCGNLQKQVAPIPFFCQARRLNS